MLNSDKPGYKNMLKDRLLKGSKKPKSYIMYDFRLKKFDKLKLYLVPSMLGG